MKYWVPGEDYSQEIATSLKNQIQDSDILVVSEKALAIATGQIIDESQIVSSLTSKFLAKYWMRYVWGYILGPLCHVNMATLSHLRNYPQKEGAIHKQMILQHFGLFQALEQGSEGGTDVSNLPFSFVSLPLRNPQYIAESIRCKIKEELGKQISVMVVDSDKTYSWKNFHFTPRVNSVLGIHCVSGFIGYLLGRLLKLRRRATPLAVVGVDTHAEKLLEISDSADRTRGIGAGKTVWDMVEKFDVPFTRVTYEMLNRVEHKPVVIVRRL
jgi:F420-0:gamma-glutamyl ligase-like protein